MADHVGWSRCRARPRIAGGSVAVFLDSALLGGRVTCKAASGSAGNRRGGPWHFFWRVGVADCAWSSRCRVRLRMEGGSVAVSATTHCRAVG